MGKFLIFLFVTLCGSPALGVLRDLAFEGTCTQPSGTLATNLDLNWITTLPKLYISYGSLQYFVQNAEACLGSNPLTLAVLSNMNLKTRWDLNTTMTCYGRSISQQCALNQNNGNPFASCFVTSSDAGTNPSIFDNYSKRVVLTDNKTFALFMRCTNGLRSYYIASPHKTISQAAILQCVYKIIELNFDITLFTRIPSKEIDCAGTGGGGGGGGAAGSY